MLKAQAFSNFLKTKIFFIINFIGTLCRFFLTNNNHFIRVHKKEEKEQNTLIIGFLYIFLLLIVKKHTNIAYKIKRKKMHSSQTTINNLTNIVYIKL